MPNRSHQSPQGSADVPRNRRVGCGKGIIQLLIIRESHLLKAKSVSRQIPCTVNDKPCDLSFGCHSGNKDGRSIKENKIGPKYRKSLR